MIDLKNHTIKVPGHAPEPIREWKVYFMTISGLFETLSEALDFVQCHDLPEFTILPVPVAVGDTTFEVSMQSVGNHYEEHNDSSIQQSERKETDSEP